MAKKRKKKRKKRSQFTEHQAQAGLLVDRLTAQDPNGASLKHFLKSLKESLANNRELAIAFVEELGKLKSSIAGTILKEIEVLFEDKAYVKALKRARFKLVQKGILKEEDRTSGSEAPVRYLVSVTDQPLSLCYFSVLEPLGEEMVFGYIPGGHDRDIVVHFVLNQNRSMALLAFEKSYYKRSMAKEIVQRLEETYKARFFEIPLEYMAFLFEEGCSKSVIDEHGKVEEAKKELKRFFGQGVQPLVYQYIDEGNIEVTPEMLEKAKELLSDGDFPLRVLPPADDIIPADRLREIFESRLIVNPETRKQQVDNIIHDSLNEYFNTDTLKNFLRVMEETALYVYLDGKNDHCLDLLAVVKDLKSNPEKVSSNPFIRKVFMRTAAIVLSDVLSEEDVEFYFEEPFDELQDTEEEEKEVESLIVLPKY